MHGEAIAVEARDRGMRLEAGVRLRAGAEGGLDQQRIARLRARSSIQLRTFFGLCENAADGPRILPFQGAGDPPPSETLPAFLRLDFSNTTGASGLRAVVEPDHRRQAFAADLDGGDGGQRGLAILGRDGGDRFADIADDAVVAEQRDRGGHARNRERRREIEFADTRMRERASAG